VPAGSPGWELAGGGDLGRVVALLDEVFVHDRGRSRSLGSRYPHVLRTPDERTRILVAPSAQAPEAVTAVRTFDVAGGVVRRGAMIGFVATRAAARGRGLASLLLDAARSEAERAGAEVAVLWTTSHAFYERLGWRAADEGLLGTLRVDAQARAATSPVRGESLDEDTARRVESLRAASPAPRIVRRPADYGAVPEPADAVHVYRVDGAYAVAGRAGTTTILYELGGDETRFEAVLASLLAGTHDLLVNDAVGSRSWRWLDARLPIAWRPQSLAMWLPLRPGEDLRLPPLHVPYLDRI
jgi:predicted N-acetyltransferase YhbS